MNPCFLVLRYSIQHDGAQFSTVQVIVLIWPHNHNHKILIFGDGVRIVIIMIKLSIVTRLIFILD